MFFYFHSLRSVRIAELRKKVVKNRNVQYKIDTGGNGNLMPVNMFKVLFPNTTIAHLNKCIDQKVILCAHNNSCIPQIGICKITTISQRHSVPMQFFCSAWKWARTKRDARKIERLQMLSINFSTIDADLNRGHVNE